MKTKYLRLFLLPLCPLYGLVSQFRVELYRAGVLKRKEFDLPTFVMGNLSTGGTGKSPHTMFLARKLSQMMNVGVLSRGYGRKTNGFAWVNAVDMAENVGDEPLMIKNRYPELSVAVCENRAVGIDKMMQDTDLDAIVMDDAYQHLGVKAGCYFLLTSYGAPFTHDFLLPAGDLREMRLGAERADCVIVTKVPELLLGDEKMRAIYTRSIRRYCSAPVIFSAYRYSDYVFNAGGRSIGLDELKMRKIVLVSGIANVNPLLNHLDEVGLEYEHLAFGDHHNFSEEDVQQIAAKLLNLQNENAVILTTEKDMMRLKGTNLPIESLYYLPIEVAMNTEDKKVFDQVVHKNLDKFSTTNKT